MIEILNMTGTNIGVYIANDTGKQIFKMSVKLNFLSLSNAEICSIPHDEFTSLNALETLDLSYNILTQVTFSVSSLFSLSLLNLSHNSINHLTANITKELDELVSSNSQALHVDLQYNPFMCDCQFLSFIKWMRQTKPAFTSKNNVLCTYKGQQRMTLVAADIDKLTTDCYLIYIVTSTVGGIALLIIATIILVYKYRWKIRSLLLKLAHWNSKKDDIEYIYDAFVVYSDEDRQWVHNVLLYEMETVRGMKLCVHFRDFIPGYDIDDQIVTAIDDSRKTLLILTKHFLLSDWCQYEMRVARNKLQAEGRDVVVPILLAELPEGLVNPAVKNLMREKSYAQWETSLGGQKYFWQKLTIAIKGKTKTRNSEMIQETGRESPSLSGNDNENDPLLGNR